MDPRFGGRIPEAGRDVKASRSRASSELLALAIPFAMAMNACRASDAATADSGDSLALGEHPARGGRRG
jgi:hypothetical protein